MGWVVVALCDYERTMRAYPTDSSPSRALRILFALPGFHREERGAEIALLSVADELAKGGDAVTVMGSGPERSEKSYDYLQVGAINRRAFERFPMFPPFRSETVWEDATFAWGLARAYEPNAYDVTLTCNYPFTHWVLRRGGSSSPRHVFVTQNGDWPAVNNQAEFRFFDCDGLVCINPDYEAANRNQWNTALIPNGIDPVRFAGVIPDRAGLGLPAEVPIVLMVSAFAETKRVLEGMRAVAPLSDVHLVVAGDGPLRGAADALAAQILPGRYTRLTLPAEQMPTLYRSSDAFLHMSLLESFGNVFVEAMASGLPIVGHDTPRLRWIVGQRETLCNTEDIAATTMAIRRAVDEGRGAADPRARDFEWSAIARQYRAFLLSVVAG